jgi:hypothetical protein
MVSLRDHSLKFSRDEDDPRRIEHCAQPPRGLFKVLRRGPREVRINHAENHAKLSDSHLSERGSAPLAGSLVRRLPPRDGIS